MIAEQRKKMREHQARLRSGKVPIESFDDADLFYSPSTDLRLTTSPLADGPKGKARYYHWLGILAYSKDGTYICWNPKHRQGFAFANVKKVDRNMRMNAPVRVIGRYTHNTQITLTNGEKRKIPILVDCYVLGPS